MQAKAVNIEYWKDLLNKAGFEILKATRKRIDAVKEGKKLYIHPGLVSTEQFIIPFAKNKGVRIRYIAKCFTPDTLNKALTLSNGEYWLNPDTRRIVKVVPSKDTDRIPFMEETASAEARVFAYHGEVITASSKEEAIKKIVADSKKPKIDMTVVNKWAKKNMDITDEGLGKDHWKNSDNGEVYYTWEAAKRLAKKVPGYHLPTAEEWNQLAEACDGICVNPKEKPNLKDYKKCGKLKQLLRIKLAGYYLDSFNFVGSGSYFWTATEDTGSLAYYRLLGTEASMSSYSNYKNRGYSVRLVRD